MHRTRAGDVSKMFSLPQLVGHNTQSNIFTVLCLTQVWRDLMHMIMSSVSCVEWYRMGRRQTFLWKYGPASFVTAVQAVSCMH